MLALALQLVGFCGFIWLPLQLPVFWAMVCGLGLGGAFPLCLLLALDHSAQPAIAGKLVAFMQGDRFLSSPGLPRGFLVCCVVSVAIT